MKIKCACGCRTSLDRYDARGRERRFMYGHSNRGRKFPNLKHNKQFKKGFTPWNKGIHKRFGGHSGLKGEKNPNWRGGSSLMRNGYVQIRVDGRKVYLHRLLVELQLGRKLKPYEQVHHIDHDKQNNDTDNLMVVTPSQHAQYHANVMWGNLIKGMI